MKTGTREPVSAEDTREPGLRDGDREIVEALGLLPSFATFREVANPSSLGLGGATAGPASGPCLQEPAMKSDSQSVPQIGEGNYVQRHSGQPKDSELLSALLENTEDSIYFKDLESRASEPHTSPRSTRPSDGKRPSACGANGSVVS